MRELRALVVDRTHYGLLLLGALAGAATVGCGIALMGVSGWLIARASEHPDEVALAVAVVGVRAFGIGRGVFRYVERLTTHDAALRNLVDLRVTLWRRMVRAFPAGVGDRRSGGVLANLVGDVEAVQDLLVRGITPPLVAAVAGAGTVTALLFVDRCGAAVLAAGLFVAAVAVPVAALLASETAGRRSATDRGVLSAAVTEFVDGIDELLVYGAVPEVLERIGATDRRLAASQRRWAWATGLTNALTVAVTGATVVGLLIVATAHQSHHALSRTGAAVLVLAGLAAFEATGPLAAAAQQLARVRASGRRLSALLDAPEALREAAEAPRSLRRVPHLTVDDVSLSLPGSDRPVLAGVTLDLPPGRRVALIGPSGAGKSSIAQLLLRLREPTAGTIRLDDIPVTELPADTVRAAVGGALADSYVFDSTARANLLIAKPDANDTELATAAAAVHLLEWIESQPLGFDTPVGVDGTELSGGERQRLALARVLLADPGIVILDEPTAHLDPVTRAGVIADVLAATRGRTLLLITHDATGLDLMDEIVHLHEGRIAAAPCLPLGGPRYSPNATRSVTLAGCRHVALGNDER